jgi:monoamine oxidase
MFDVVIVGAGLSGLEAAHSAQKRGLSALVLEARDRIGGKVWSVPLASGRGCADLGAAWINDSLQPRVWSYVKKFGLEVTKQRLEGKAVHQDESGKRIVFPFGTTPEFTEEEKSNLGKIRDHIQAASLRTNEAPREEDDNVSLDSYVRKLGAGEKTARMINVWSQVMHGVESTEQSAAWFIDYCRRNKGLLAIRADDHTGGQHLRLNKGAQAIVDGLGQLVGSSNIRLSSPVASIEDREGHVNVRTTTGQTVTAKKVIIALPSTLYKDINITPALGPRLSEVANNTVLGDYNKAIVCYDKPWWRDLGYNGFIISYKGPVIVARDTSTEANNMYSLTCFVNGRSGGEWGNKPSHERRRAVLEQLASVFNVGKDSELWRPIEMFEQVWKHEQYSKGALVPITSIGHYTKFDDVYGKPVGNLHFSGTEFSPEWKGYMEGALCAGERSAEEVAASLKEASRL